MPPRQPAVESFRAPPRRPGPATAIEAYAAALDAGLQQITDAAAGLAQDDPAAQAEQVHQLRVGIRRLRTALRSFRGCAPAPAAPLVEALRTLFAELGRVRDASAAGTDIAAELARAGAPPSALLRGDAGPDPVRLVQAAATQATLRAWTDWRATLAVAPPGAAGAPTWRRKLGRRLGRWHAGIVGDCLSFDALDDAALHALRKRIKRQRYAVEFLAAGLRQRPLGAYLGALAEAQDRMGRLNDLFVARARYQALPKSEPGAWFALGWLAAQIAQARQHAEPALARLAQTPAPTAFRP